MQMENNTSNKKSEVELVSERVLRTRKEIQLLESQLLKLISDGRKKTDFSEIKQNIASICTDYKTGLTTTDNEIEVNSAHSNEIEANKARNCKDSVANIITPRETIPDVHLNIALRHKEKSPPIKQNEESPKKVRHYDKKAVRDYMRMKRKKEQESKKNIKNETVITQEIKKQKLQELRQKSLQLVSKNIQHKRERSKSRTRNVHNTSLENESLDNKDVLGEDILPLTNVTVDQEKPSMKFAHLDLKNVTIRPKLRDLSSTVPKLDIPRHIQLDNDDISNHNEVVSVRNSLEDKNKAAIKIQVAFRGYLQRKRYKLLKQMQKRKQVTKEVQTVEVEKEFPFVLQPTVAPYPYNFINAVKRKLNLAVQQITSSSTKDVAIQSSLNEAANHESQISKEKSSQVTNNNNKSISNHEQAIKSNNQNIKSSSNLKNTDLKSFLSHKCLNLDIKAVEPLVLTRNSVVSTKQTKTDLHNGIGSDSDTSKNIPEISSESSIQEINNKRSKQHSSKRSHSSDTDNDNNKLKINTDRVKKLKLLQPRRINFNNQNNDSQMNEEISEHISTVKSRSLSKSSKENLNDLKINSVAAQNGFSTRDSIIAFNKCDYSSAHKRSIQKYIDTNTENLESKRKLLEPKSETNKKLIIEPVFDTLNSFRNYMNNIDNTEEVSQISPEKISVNKPDKSESKETSLKTPTEILDVNTEKSEKTNDKPQEYSSNFTSIVSSIPSLKHPSVSLKSYPISNSQNTTENDNIRYPSASLKRSRQTSDSEKSSDDNNSKAITNILLKPGERTCIENKVKSNEIHLKFEAELHLLNEFNDSLRQVMEVEKSILELHNNNNNRKLHEDKTTTTYHTRDTQTSFKNKSSTDTKISTESPIQENKNSSETRIPSINYSRGSEVSEQIDIFGLDNTVDMNDTSPITTGLELSQIKENLLTSSAEESNVDITVSRRENHFNGNMYAGLSLEMFEQLIKDEDARIENLKTILKIREKALVDRTKGELAWLEIQKKHLRDSGQLQEISAIKKKQRGLLIKLEHERHEMQRLKQMQKAASKERKSVLRGQRNMIKAQLSNTNNMITKIKRNTKEERRQSGPLKVYNIKSHSESIRSETSMSRRSSVAEEIVSVVSHSQSIVSHVTEEAIVTSDKMSRKNSESVPIISKPQIRTEHVKRSLLMREAALQKRRKAAEELLQWHQRLLEEEGKIAELELAASAIINQAPVITENMVSDEKTVEKHKFKGSQLNLLWYNMTGREEKKFNDQITYSMSKVSLERFCKDARKYSHSDRSNKKSEKYSDSDSSAIKTDIDVTSNIVTDLTEGKRKSKSSSGSSSSNSTNISEKSKKYRSRISNLSNEIVINDVKTNKDGHITDYTSDFESFLSGDKFIDSIKTDDEIEKKDFSSEISISDNEDAEPETIAEISKPSSKTEIIDQNSSMKQESHNEIVEYNKIDDKTDHLNIDEQINEIPTTENSEINRDATSKDVSTDIENDEKQEIVAVADSIIISDAQESVHAEDSNDEQHEDVSLDKISEMNENEIVISEPILDKTNEHTNNNTTNDTLESHTNITDKTEDSQQFNSNKIDEKEDSDTITSKGQSHITPIQIGNEEEEHPQTEIEENEHISKTDTIEDDQTNEDQQPSIIDESHKTSEFHELTANTTSDIIPTEEKASINEQTSVKSELEQSNQSQETEEISTDTNRKVESPVLLSYGFIDNNQSQKDDEDTISNQSSDILTDKEEKSHSDLSENKNKTDFDKTEEEQKSEKEISQKKSHQEGQHFDVKKRVSEILADANISSPREDKSPRLQDLYVTAYDVASPEHSSDSGSPTDEPESVFRPLHPLYTNEEVEELLKKQLEIEQEIKEIQQQQQKEHIPYLYVREIPNKPPPPYTPPVSAQSITSESILPASEKQVTVITASVADILHEAYLNKNLQNISLSSEDIKNMQIKNNIEKPCLEFIFDLCKEAAIDHYKQFETETGPSWMHLTKQHKLAMGKPFNRNELEKFIATKVKQWLGYETIKSTENIKRKWSGKKRDHVDELLVVECQAEETEWTNYDRDELLVKDELTKDIMNMLLSETAQVLSNILNKKAFLC